MPVKLKGATSGDITLDVPAAAGTNTLTLPAKTGNIITSADTGTVTPTMLSQPLTRMTAQNSTSGTSVPFSSIPSWAKKITIAFNGVSTSGTSIIQVQLGTGGAATTSGYSAMCGGTGVTSNTTGSSGAFTTGVPVDGFTPAASYTRTGVLTFANVSGNIWVGSGVIYGLNINYTGGGVTLAGVLDYLRITTVNGTDTFDAGSVNVMYEG